MQRQKNEKDKKGKLVLNAEQFDAATKIADRVVVELRHAAKGNLDFGEPLRWLVHGGLGIGKSHVILQIK